MAVSDAIRVTDLDLSPAPLAALEALAISRVDDLARHPAAQLLEDARLSDGVQLHELVCKLHRHGLAPFARSGGHRASERELDMFRLRAVEGLTYDEIAKRFDLSRERVRQLLGLHFGLDGVPPAVKDRLRRRRALRAGRTGQPASRGTPNSEVPIGHPPDLRPA